MSKTIDSSRQLAIRLLKHVRKEGTEIRLGKAAKRGLLEILNGKPHDYWYFCLCRDLLRALKLENCIEYDFDEERWFASVEVIDDRGPLKGCHIEYVIPPINPEWLD